MKNCQAKTKQMEIKLIYLKLWVSVARNNFMGLKSKMTGTGSSLLTTGSLYRLVNISHTF